ncbi:hypothetical protein NE237_027101 [Protea cynaroides]|uniref:Uncharacterized protein n=1 Tax=Protea cynaroides TaxID=273540 RepID=A0A9Q0JRL2_9MAGN|nr:hypothetical protein NE237_027101 [Protea cynaroides]
MLVPSSLWSTAVSHLRHPISGISSPITGISSPIIGIPALPPGQWMCSPLFHPSIIFLPSIYSVHLLPLFPIFSVHHLLPCFLKCPSSSSFFFPLSIIFSTLFKINRKFASQLGQ